MGFNFGNIRTSQTIKKVDKTVEPLLFERRLDGQKGYNVLVPYAMSTTALAVLKKLIESAGIKSYRIIATCNVEDPRKKISTKDRLKTESNWYELLMEHAPGAKYKMVLTIGEALYVVNRSADFDAYPFLDHVFDETRFVASSDFLKADMIIYPTYPFSDWWPIHEPKCSNKGVFENWRTRHGMMQLKRMAADDADPSKYIDVSDYRVKKIESIDEASKLLDDLGNSDVLAFDLETTGLSYLENKIGCITFCNDGIIGYYVPWNFIEEGRLKRKLLAVLTSARRLVGHNAKFDTKFLWEAYGKSEIFYPTDDTMMLIHCIHTERNQGLKPAAYFYTYFGGYDNVLDEVKEQLKVESYMDIPKEYLTKYAAIDAIVTWRILAAAEKHAKKIDNQAPNWKDKNWGIWRWYTDVAMPMLRDAIDCEYEGIYVDRDELDFARKTLDDAILSYKRKLVEIWNAEYNAGINESFEFESTKKAGELVKKMGWPVVKLNKREEYGTDESCFAEWERRGYKGVKEWGELRSHLVAYNSFVGYYEKEQKGKVVGELVPTFGRKKYKKMVEDESGWETHLVFHGLDGRFVKNADRSRRDGTWRMHPNINCMGTNTFRHSIQNPSMQNIPTTGKIGKIVKRCISVPDPKKYKLSTSDYVSLQMILVFRDCCLNPKNLIGHEGVDQVMLDIYGHGGHKDSHSQTGFAIFYDAIDAHVYEAPDGTIYHEKQKNIPDGLKKRKATFSDFLKLKKTDPTETYRTNSKGVNFGNLFGAAAPSLARRLREVYKFTEKDCDDVISLMGLKKMFDFMVAERRQFKQKSIPEKEFILDMKFLCIATKFRDVFFTTYPALMCRLEREKNSISDEDSNNFGYMQSWKGPKRRLPEIRHMQPKRQFYTKDRKPTGEPLGKLSKYRWDVVKADKILWSKLYAELGNIAGNSDAQILEAYSAFTLWHNLHTNLKRWGFKSRVFNGTHDSLDKFLYEGEEELVLAMEAWVASRPSIPFEGMPLEIEATLSDVSSHEQRQETFYKNGKQIRAAKFVEALKKYNAEHGTDLKWYNTLPTDYDASEMPSDMMIIERKGYTVQ